MKTDVSKDFFFAFVDRHTENPFGKLLSLQKQEKLEKKWQKLL